MNYYSIEHPEINELVLVIFNQNLQNEGIFKGLLVEYPNYQCIMSYQDTTKKKKVISWNKIITLNKNMVVKVEDIDINTKNIQVSMAYLYDNNLKSNINNIQSELLIYFQENKLMSQFINTLCLVNNYNYKYIWETLIYHLDKLRRINNTSSQQLNPTRNKSIWNYFNENINDINKWINDLNMNEYYNDSIMKLYNKKNEIIIQKITTKFGIINSNNIEEIIDIFNIILSDIKFKYSLKYDSTPYYIFQSETIDSNINDHEYFINTLKNNINNNTFLKINYIGNIS